MLDPGPADIVQFGIFEADLRTGELRRNGSRVRLQDQPFQVLALLLKHPGQIVTREELHARLWPANTFVDFDHGLNAAVKRLRDALGDSAENPHFVETLARRGYRFLAPVTPKLAAAVPIAPVVQASSFSARFFPRWRWGLAIAGVLLIGIATGWHAGHRSAASLRFEERRLTGNLESDPILSAAISPDAKYVVFADRSGLFLRLLSTGETHPLVLPDHFKVSNVSWFPDGNHVLVTVASFGLEKASLWSASIFGGPPQKLVENGERGAVSPDGSQIVFLRAQEGGEEIWRMDSDGQQPGRILGQAGDNFASVVWSPDSRHIAFVRSVFMHGPEESDGSLGVCDPLAQNTKYILSSARLRGGLVWALDGRLIYALGEPAPRYNDSNIWSIRIDTRGNQSWGEPSRLSNGPDLKLVAGISADGRHLLFLRRTETPDIYVADVKSDNAALGPLHSLGLAERRNLPFAWTSDSRSVIFSSNRDGANHVFKRALDQPAPDLVVGGEQNVQGVRLNPDGSQILYLLTPLPTDSDRRVRMMRVPISGGVPQQVLAEVGITNAQCARTPAAVCILSKASSAGLTFLTFDPVTGKENEFTRIEDQEWYSYNWTLSPDGSTLAVSKHRIQVSAVIRLLPVAGGVERTLTAPPWAGITYMDWAPDGRSLWVRASSPTGTATLLNVDLHGRATPALQESDMELGWAIPSPDGRRLALWKARDSSSAWLLDSF